MLLGTEVFPLRLHLAVLFQLGITFGILEAQLLIDRDKRLLYSFYQGNEGNPLETTRQMLKELYALLPEGAYIGNTTVTGYGEASMPQYLGQSVESVMAFLSKVDLGRFSDPFVLEDILSYIDSLSEGDSAAKAAVDIALHDLVGKLLGAPWYRIWGLDAQKAPATSFTIGIDTPEVVREKTLECAGRFKVLKAKVGVPEDRMLIGTIREVTDLPLVVDANQGWTDRQKALDEIFWLKEMGVLMVEQPMSAGRLDDNAWITERSPLPIFADEAVQRLADIPGIKGAYHGINIKLMKCTGMREAWKMLNYARAEGMKVMLGCMTETSCAVSAAAQLSPAVDFADLDGNLLIDNDIFKGVQVVDGKLTLGDAPGIGAVSVSD